MRTWTREVCVTRRNNYPSWATATEELLKPHTTTPIIVLWKRADSVVCTTLTPYPIAERILFPQLYVLSKYQCTIDRGWGDSAKMCISWRHRKPTEYICSYKDVEPSSSTCNRSSHLQMLWDLVACSSSYHFTVMTQSVYNEPRISTHTQAILLHKHRHTFDVLHSLFPRCSPPVVLQATVGGREDLGMRLLLCDMYASG